MYTKTTMYLYEANNIELMLSKTLLHKLRESETDRQKLERLMRASDKLEQQLQNPAVGWELRFDKDPTSAEIYPLSSEPYFPPTSRNRQVGDLNDENSGAISRDHQLQSQLKVKDDRIRELEMQLETTQRMHQESQTHDDLTERWRIECFKSRLNESLQTQTHMDSIKAKDKTIANLTSTMDTLKQQLQKAERESTQLTKHNESTQEANEQLKLLNAEYRQLSQQLIAKESQMDRQWRDISVTVGSHAKSINIDIQSLGTAVESKLKQLESRLFFLADRVRTATELYGSSLADAHERQKRKPLDGLAMADLHNMLNDRQKLIVKLRQEVKALKSTPAPSKDSKRLSQDDLASSLKQLERLQDISQRLLQESS